MQEISWTISYPMDTYYTQAMGKESCLARKQHNSLYSSRDNANTAADVVHYYNTHACLLILYSYTGIFYNVHEVCKCRANTDSMQCNMSRERPQERKAKGLKEGRGANSAHKLCLERWSVLSLSAKITFTWSARNVGSAGSDKNILYSRSKLV